MRRSPVSLEPCIQRLHRDVFGDQPAGGAEEITLLAGALGAGAGVGDLEAMLTAALDGLLELSGAERGLILVLDRHHKVMLGRARGRSGRDLEPSRWAGGQAILERVRRGSWPIAGSTPPPANDNAGTFADSGRSGRARRLTVASAPASGDTGFCGVVYLESRNGDLPEEAQHVARSLVRLAADAAVHGPSVLWRWRAVDAVRWNAP